MIKVPLLVDNIVSPRRHEGQQPTAIVTAVDWSILETILLHDLKSKRLTNSTVGLISTDST